MSWLVPCYIWQAQVLSYPFHPLLLFFRRSHLHKQAPWFSIHIFTCDVPLQSGGSTQIPSLTTPGKKDNGCLVRRLTRIWCSHGSCHWLSLAKMDERLVGPVEHAFTLEMRAHLLRDAMIPNLVKDCQRRSRNSRWMILAEKECLSQGFYERWTDEQKSLPLFSFLLFKAKLTSGICGFPLDARIHKNCLSNSLCVSFDPFSVTAHGRQQCPSCTPCQELKAQQPQKIPFFRKVMTPSLMLVRPGRRLILVDFFWVCYCHCHDLGHGGTNLPAVWFF